MFYKERHTEVASERLLRELKPKTKQASLLIELQEITQMLNHAKKMDLPKRDMNKLFERYLQIISKLNAPSKKRTIRPLHKPKKSYILKPK